MGDILTKIKIKILDVRFGISFPFPMYATEGSSGLDLIACLNKPIILEPGQCELISSGIAIYIEDKSVAAMVLPRGGLGHMYGVVLGNLVGLIDSDYQGLIEISCWNRSQHRFVISPGMRIAQLVFFPISRPIFQVVAEFEPSERGENGFGSTGGF